MRPLNYLLIVTTSVMLMSSPSFANATSTSAHAPVVFQVIQDQINLEKPLIKSASLITNKDGSFGGIQIELNPSSAKELKRITAAGVGKVANLVINGRIVTSATLRSPLESKFIIYDSNKTNIYGISKDDAQKFIDSLHE